jgi:hypothetical protein
MMNHDRFDANFWDQSFRLSVNGVPMAPDSGLNELVSAESAQGGTVLFVIPHGTTDGTLKITPRRRKHRGPSRSYGEGYVNRLFGARHRRRPSHRP